MSRNTDQIEVQAAVLELLLPRLQERREAIQKEVLKYGEAPAGIKEVFELCRGFERAYVSFVNESPVAGKIKEAFMGEKGLAGAIRKQPLEKVYDLVNVKQVARQADGYQPHLVSPENGLRALASEALDFVSGPVNQCVQTVYTLLLNAAREAAEKAGQFTEAALMGALPMNVPDFKNVVMPAIVTALDEWKKEAERMAMMLVDMERTYMSAGFFRHTMYHRANKIKQQQALQQAAEAGKAQGGKGVFGGKSFFPAFGASSSQPTAGAGASTSTAPATPPPPPSKPAAAGNDAASDGSVDGDTSAAAKEGAPDASPQAGGGNFNAAEMTDPNSFLAGMFEKYNGTDNAFTSMASGLRWQRRFFIFSEAQRMVYYFKNAEDVAKGGQPRGMVNIAECVIEDLDAQGNARGPASGPADKAQLLIRIRHKDPRQSAVKDHSALVLRAESLEQKTQWLVRLRRASEPRRAAAKGENGDADASKSGGAFSSFGGSLTNMMDDMAWAKDAEPIIDTHLGEGSAAFRADNVRDNEGRLLPAPQTLINPMRLAEKARKANGTAAFDARHDAIMEQLGADMSIYTRMVSDTVITTVPKAIVHAMIRKSEKNLLERLFTVIHHLTPVQLETLLKEEDSIVKCRKEARAALEDCKQAIFVVQQLMERRNMMNAADRPATVTLPANCFAYSGTIQELSKEQVEYYETLFSSEFAPEALKAWKTPPQVRSLPAAIAAAVARNPQGQPQPGRGPAPGGPVPARAPPGAPPGRAAPAVPQRPPPTQPGMGPPVARRAPPPPPGQR